MDKRYVELFKELAKATAVSAEQVMDYDRAKNDEEGLKTAQTMRDDYCKSDSGSPCHFAEGNVWLSDRPYPQA